MPLIENIRRDGEHFEFTVYGKTWRFRDKPCYPVVKSEAWIRSYFAILLWLLADFPTGS